MTERERFLACMLGRPVDRPPYLLLFGPWPTTLERWEREAGPEAAKNYIGMFNPDHAPQVVPVNLGPCPRVERTVLAEDERYITFIDHWGIRRRDYKGGTSMSEFLDFPVKDREEWARYKAERLDPDHPGRLAGGWRQKCADWMRWGYPIQLGYYPDTGLYGSVRWLLGDEECLLAFYTMPDLVHEIMDHMTTLYLTVFEKVMAAGVRVDVIHIWEDMCGRQGPLISPRHWEEFMGPGYRRVRAFARKHDIPIISVDTDGNPDLIIPPMMAAGVNYVWPMEVAAGCDVNVLRDRYPALAMSGGVDKRPLAVGPAAIDAELERVRPAMEKGRYIPCIDHNVPDNVSWSNYVHYAEGLRKLVEKE